MCFEACRLQGCLIVAHAFRAVVLGTVACPMADAPHANTTEHASIASDSSGAGSAGAAPVPRAEGGRHAGHCFTLACALQRDCVCIGLHNSALSPGLVPMLTHRPGPRLRGHGPLRCFCPLEARRTPQQLSLRLFSPEAGQSTKPAAD